MKIVCTKENSVLIRFNYNFFNECRQLTACIEFVFFTFDDKIHFENNEYLMTLSHESVSIFKRYPIDVLMILNTEFC